MIGLLIQARLNTISTHNGTVNYLFRKPDNAPTNLIQQIAPEKSVFSVFLLSKTVVQNFNIELTLTSNKATLIALSYNSAIGVSFEYLRYVIHCDSCKKLSFAPMLMAPQVSLWYCVIDIKKASYIIMPQFAMIIHTRFYVDQFSMKKSRFLTFKDNTVNSNSVVSSPNYQQIGKKVDAAYAIKNDRCIQCHDPTFRTDSSCTCDQTGTMMGGQCYKQFRPTDLLSTPDTNQKYFLECNQASRSTITIEYNLTEPAAVNFSTFKDGACSINKLVLQGYINIIGDNENHLYGISYIATTMFANVNISLNITQKGSGMKSSSLCFGRQQSFCNFQTIRITGSLVSEGKSSNDSFSLVFVTTTQYASVNQVGIYGSIIKVSSECVGFIVGNVTSSSIYVNYIYIAPNIPTEYQIFSTAYIQKAEVLNKAFPCFGYSSEDQQKSLMMGNFFDILQTFDKQWIQSEIIISGGGMSYVGGVIGAQLEQSYSSVGQSAIMLNIENDAQSDSEYKCIGLVAGQVNTNFAMSQDYVEGNITSKANYVGVVGYAQFGQYAWVTLSIAAKVKLTGKQNIGIFGFINGFGGTYMVDSIFDATLTGTANVGMFGEMQNISCNTSAVGRIIDAGGNAQLMIGTIGETVKLYGVLQQAGPAATIAGSSVNFCSSDMLSSIKTVEVADLIKAETVTQNLLYGIECQTQTILKVSITKDYDGFKSIEIMKDDSCSPRNLYIKGDLLINTPDNNIPTQLIIAGYTLNPANNMQFMNFSLNIAHTGNNGTKQVSLVAIEPQKTLATIEYISISGKILGDSKQDYLSECYASFLFTKTVDGGSIYIKQINLFGASIEFSGADAIGLIAVAVAGSSCSFSYVFITSSTAKNKFMSELSYDKNYYYQDLCSRYLSSSLGKAFSMQQYQTYVNGGIPSKIVLFGKKSHHVSMILGYSAVEGTRSCSFYMQYLSLRASIEAEADASAVGLLLGSNNGYYSSYNSYVEGNVTAKYRAGIVGETFAQASLCVAAKVNITGNQYLGTYGFVSSCYSNPELFIDMIIKYSQNYVGGLCGYIERSQYFSASAFVARIQIIGEGKPADLVVGSCDDLSKHQWYDGAIINKC